MVVSTIIAYLLLKTVFLVIGYSKKKEVPLALQRLSFGIVAFSLAQIMFL